MCVKIVQKGGVFVHSNIYEYLCDRLEDIPRILEICGADRRYIGKNSSDYERFRELCRTLVSFSGSGFYKDVNRAVSELLGESIDISRNSPADLWKRFYGERDDVRAPDPVLTVKIAYADKFRGVVNISKATALVVPDKYHVALAREKLADGYKLSESEENMLLIQELREEAQKCVGSSRRLVIIADCPSQITLGAFRYLKACNLLPEALVLVSIDRMAPEMISILDSDEISLGILLEMQDENAKRSMGSCPEHFPVGNVIWTTKMESAAAFDGSLRHLLEKWQAENTAPQNCALKIEEICKFY